MKIFRKCVVLLVSGLLFGMPGLEHFPCYWVSRKGLAVAFSLEKTPIAVGGPGYTHRENPLARTAVAVFAQAPAEVQAKAPALVMIIRHAEKPLGDTKDPNLAPQGFKRAAALPNLFVTPPGSAQAPRFPRPDALFASDAAKHSNRPMETLAPLAQALNERIDHDYADLETKPLAKQVLSGKYAGKVVLICWHHGEIPSLAAAFGVADEPRKWNEDVFDQVWEINWVDGQAKLKIVPQRLMPGDSNK